MNIQRILALLAAMIVVSAIVVAAEPKPITSRDGACQVSVPSNWTAGSVGGIDESPDKKLSIVASSPKMVDSFAELKQPARSIHTDSKVTKDSAAEFEIEGQPSTGKPNIYRAIPISGNKICIAEITHETGTADAPRSIIQSLKSAK